MKISGRLEQKAHIDSRTPVKLCDAPPGIYETTLDDYNEKYMWLIHNGYVYSFEDGILTGTVFSQGYQSRLVVPAVKGTRVVLEFES